MIRRLARCIREYKWAALLSPLCMVGEVAMEVLIPLVMADLYDYGIKMQDMQVVAAKSGILVLCALASLSFGVLSAAFASKAGTGFAKNLRHDMYHQVQDFSFSNIDKFSTASIVTRLTSDVATLQNTFQMMIRMAIRCPMMLILALVSAMGISVRLSLVYCVALPILICALLCLIPKVFRIFDRVFRTYDKMNNVVQENVHGIRVVKSFVREDRETEKFTSVSGTIYKDFCKAERIMSLANPIMQLCVYGCMLAISWIGAHLVIAYDKCRFIERICFPCWIFIKKIADRTCVVSDHTIFSITDISTFDFLKSSFVDTCKQSRLIFCINFCIISRRCIYEACVVFRAISTG